MRLSDLFEGYEEQNARFDELAKFLGPRSDSTHPRNQRFLHKVASLASEKQMESARKMHKYGWRLSKIVWNKDETKAALGFTSKMIGGWVMPDGELIRPTPGKTRVYLPKGWDESKEVDL